ncbi:MAG TPA: beta-L-arabinofuranosidase domain-containing protein, partial [Steroidobacteraceae bacterium]
MSHSRRDAMKLLGAGAAAAALPWTAAGNAARATHASGLHYFALADVRLGEGPFLHAQKLDEKYLLLLEPDRMLANFRTNAGVRPRAPVYGGWESVEPWIDIRCHGHTAGHYLTAASCMYETTADPRFAERVDYMVSELAECQAKTGGWLTAFPDGVAPLTDSLAGREFAGVPWYTTHKVLAGLRDAHLHRGSKQALEVAVKFADWIDRACTDVPEDRFQKMLDREHGGMNEVLADLHAITGDARYGRLAQRFSHQALLKPLSVGDDKLNGLHANTQIPKVIGFSRIAETQQGVDGAYDAAAKYFWDTVVNHRSFATGGHGDREHFFPTDEFARHLDSGKTMETCCTHNMLRLTRSLYGRDPQVAYVDYFEKALFNGILAAQDPETGMNTYFQSTRPGYVRLYHQPFDTFWCCTGSGIENHARYGETIYAHDDDTLYINLFLASTLSWKERDVTVTQTTRFPDADTTRLQFKVGQKSPLLAIRQPAWCPVMAVT